MEFPTTSIVMMLILAGGMYYGNRQFKNKRAEWGKTLTIGCAISIIVLTIWTNLFRSPDSGPRDREYQYQIVQATVLANNLATMYTGKGKCLVIHGPNYTESANEHVERLVKGFKHGFQNRVTEVRAVPIRDVASSSSGLNEEDMMAFTSKDFNRVIKENSDCDMMILLVQLPHSEDELFEMDPFLMIEDPNNPGKWIKDPKKDYPLVGVFNGFIGNSETLFHDKLLGAMSMWRPNPTIDEKPVPEDIQEAFNKRYVVVTRDNIEDVRTKFPTIFPEKRQ